MSKQMTFRTTDAIAEAIRQAANAETLKEADIMRRAVVEYLDRHHPQLKPILSPR